MLSDRRAARSLHLVPSDDRRIRGSEPVDFGQCEHHSPNAGVSTYRWVMLDVPSKFGFVSLGFGVARLVSHPYVPRRVVPIGNLGRGSGRGWCVDH